LHLEDLCKTIKLPQVVTALATEEQVEAMRVENEVLGQKLENIGESLALCEKKVVPVVSQAASDSILQELLS
jgi:hypothetical protein